MVYFRALGMTEPDNRSYVAAIADQYGRRLRRFLAVRLRNASDVPDLAQEVFLRLLRVDDHASIRSPEAYLFTVASHVVHQHAARQLAAPVTIGIEDLPGSEGVSDDDPPARVDLQQRIEELQRAMDQLPPRLAATLVLARVGGHSLEEIARQLGVSRESVKKYLARALEHCRERQGGSE